MGWGAVWQLAAKAFVAEPVEFRIVILVGLAFAALMVLIGLKHAFRSSGPAADPAPAPQPFYPKLAIAPEIGRAHV